MKERPILFKGEMVRAILGGRKTQTRRVVNWKRLQKQAGLSFPTKCRLAFFRLINNWGIDAGDDVMREVSCPHGKIGDRLWVRETSAQNNDQLSDDYSNTKIMYRADGEQRALDNGVELPWTPSIFMPRSRCRILLEITNVRVERLNDISEADAKAEGCEPGGWRPSYSDPDNSGGHESWPATDEFHTLWETINGKGSWDLNPVVWVICFKLAAK